MQFGLDAQHCAFIQQSLRNILEIGTSFSCLITIARLSRSCFLTVVKQGNNNLDCCSIAEHLYQDNTDTMLLNCFCIMYLGLG